ncbi:MAG: hypothetical protein FWC43_02215 [Planctomycetaceae bacterium]|nr:hypothetical protein [Planctomycetaceae bacterium]
MISEIPRCTKFCAVTGREIVPGQTVFSVLLEEGGNYKRIDYSHEGWQERRKGRPKNSGETEGQILGWWKHQLPVLSDKKVKLAPNDILLTLFEQLAEQPDKQDLRYVLVLLLIRRRVFRLEKEEKAGDGEPWDKITVYHPKTDTTHEIFVTVPEQERIEQVQEELAGLITNY